MQLACAIAAGGVIVLSAISVRAQECAAAGDGTEQAALVPGDEPNCAEVIPDLDLSLPADADLPVRQEPVARLPVDAASSEPLPIAITPSETGGGARASLQTLRDYNAQKQARKLDAARAAAPATLPAVQGPKAAQSAVDIWSSVDAQGFDAEASRKLKTGAGLDYRVVKNASVGVVAERAEAAAPGAALGSATDEKVSAYVAFKALPAVSIDARTKWERSQTFDAGNAAGSGVSEKSSVVVAPRVSKPFALEDGLTLEPYVEVKHEIGLGGAGGGDGGALSMPSGSAGAGLNLAKPGSYAVSVSTDVASGGESAAPNVNSKVQLRVPLD